MKHEVLKAKIVNGDIRCPRCNGGYAMGVGLWCRGCHGPVLVEAPGIKRNMRRHQSP